MLEVMNIWLQGYRVSSAAYMFLPLPPGQPPCWYLSRHGRLVINIPGRPTRLGTIVGYRDEVPRMRASLSGETDVDNRNHRCAGCKAYSPGGRPSNKRCCVLPGT